MPSSGLGPDTAFLSLPPLQFPTASVNGPLYLFPDIVASDKDAKLDLSLLKAEEALQGAAAGQDTDLAAIDQTLQEFLGHDTADDDLDGAEIGPGISIQEEDDEAGWDQITSSLSVEMQRQVVKMRRPGGIRTLNATLKHLLVSHLGYWRVRFLICREF